MTTWLVQQTRNPTETVRAIERVCGEQNLPFQFVPQIPFSRELPDLPNVAPPFVFYGYTTLILNAYQSPLWRSGVFYDPANFRPFAYQSQWGHDQMVSPFQFVPLRELRIWWSSGHTGEPLFLKPDDDLKRFSGGVMNYAEFDEWYSRLETGNDEDAVSPETHVAYASPAAEMGPEFRVFLVEGRAVAASSYLPHGGLAVPPEVVEYAEARANIWQPAPVFVLDVAYIAGEGESSLRVVEANCFNGSAFYRADVGAIVWQVSRYQQATCELAIVP